MEHRRPLVTAAVACAVLLSGCLSMEPDERDLDNPATLFVHNKAPQDVVVVNLTASADGVTHHLGEFPVPPPNGRRAILEPDIASGSYTVSAVADNGATGSANLSLCCGYKIHIDVERTTVSFNQITPV